MFMRLRICFTSDKLREYSHYLKCLHATDIRDEQDIGIRKITDKLNIKKVMIVL